jgi:hypothetical protein
VLVEWVGVVFRLVKKSESLKIRGCDELLHSSMKRGWESSLILVIDERYLRAFRVVHQKDWQVLQLVGRVHLEWTSSRVMAQVMFVQQVIPSPVANQLIAEYWPTARGDELAPVLWCRPRFQ